MRVLEPVCWLPLVAVVTLLSCRPDDSLGDSQHPWALWGTDGYGQQHWVNDYDGPREAGMRGGQEGLGDYGEISLVPARPEAEGLGLEPKRVEPSAKLQL